MRNDEEGKAGRPRGKVYPVLKQIRLRVEDAADLEELATRWRCNEAEVMRRLLREGAERERERKGAE